MISISRAIKDINPNAEFSVDNDNINNIEWLNGTTPISVADIQARQTLMETRDAHIVPRQMAYPSLQQQLDMMYHDQVNGTTTWKDAIAQVKADNPKSE
jgi:hypothetical protein|tara:strand:- start:41 stop:337 length:297 start_codon:yes stop_codon:yes gene_type:complete